MLRILTILTLVFISLSPSLAVHRLHASNTDKFKFLTFDEIKAFSKTRTPGQSSQDKLKETFNTVFYSAPNKRTWSITNNMKFHSKLKRNVVRVSHWNIERGFNLDIIQQLLTDPDTYLSDSIDPELDSEGLTKVQQEIKLLQNTDIFTLNEVDWGIQRTGYKNIAQEFAKFVDGNYVFAAEFLEVDPGLIDDPNVDPSRYKGLHGNAIVSKFPIRKARILRLPFCYDWFAAERANLTPLEHVRRGSSKAVVQEKIITEVRQGRRTALIADITLPNGKDITVISTHLENRVLPKCRELQMQALLEDIKDIENPVIIGADLNNFETSAEPTSVTKVVKNTVKDPQNLAKATISWFNPYALVVNLSSLVVGTVRKHKDPTVKNIPIILRNKARKLFKIIEKFRFTDGGQFDYSGDDDLVHGHDGTLSNSNQRGIKGFIETYKFTRSFKVARFKIDWLFVKPLRVKGCDDDEDFEDLDWECKRYFPAYGRTLKDLNYSCIVGAKSLGVCEKGHVSDHNPVTLQVVF